MSQALVDVIVPSYNRRSLLKRACASVQNQTYSHWNLLIVDDGSTDGTSEEFYGEKIKILKLKENKGVSYARNQGLRHTKAEWIAFLDSDDEWLEQKLEKQIQYAQKHPQYPWIHCNEIWKKRNQLFNQKKKHKKQGGRIFTPSVKLCCVSPSAVLLKRSLLKECGFFREDFPVCEDYELWLRLSSMYSIGFLEEPLVIKHGGHEDQLSKKYYAMDDWRIKALFPYLENQHISLEEKQEVKKTLIEKTKILIQGYKKHKNFKKQEEMEKLLSSLIF